MTCVSFRSGFVKLGFGSWGIVIERSLATSRRHFVLFSKAVKQSPVRVVCQRACFLHAAVNQ
uniref:Uncharacterized protein n=1 Tax=Helianthus annuus TaxID=4232 RepID=A0A251SYZ0_HELAN